MAGVFLWRAGEDKDVIQVNDDKDIQVVPEHIIHEMLEDCRGIGEAKRHHKVLKMAITGAEGSFPLIPRANPNKVVSPMKVNLGEDGGRGEAIKEVGDEGQG